MILLWQTAHQIWTSKYELCTQFRSWYVNPDGACRLQRATWEQPSDLEPYISVLERWSLNAVYVHHICAKLEFYIDLLLARFLYKNRASRSLILLYQNWSASYTWQEQPSWQLLAFLNIFCDLETSVGQIGGKTDGRTHCNRHCCLAEDGSRSNRLECGATDTNPDIHFHFV